MQLDRWPGRYDTTKFGSFSSSALVKCNSPHHSLPVYPSHSQRRSKRLPCPNAPTLLQSLPARAERLWIKPQCLWFCTSASPPRCWKTYKRSAARGERTDSVKHKLSFGVSGPLLRDFLLVEIRQNSLPKQQEREEAPTMTLAAAGALRQKPPWWTKPRKQTSLDTIWKPEITITD